MSVSNRSYIITDIEWERIFLRLEIKGEHKGDAFHVVNAKKQNERYPLTAVENDGGYSITINMACVHDREFLENGRWFFVAGDERCAVSAELAHRAEELSRIFRYAEDQMAYTVSWGIETEDEQTLDIYMDSYFLEENRKWRKRRYIREVRSPRAKAGRAVIAAASKAIAGTYHVVNTLSPHRGDRVMIMSQSHDYLWGNLKAIDTEIKKQGLDSKYKITYELSRNAGRNSGIRDAVSWIRSAAKAARQDIIFIDDYTPLFGFFKPDRRTEIIQAWHAGLGFKSVGYARFGRDGSPFPQGSTHKQYTNAIVGAEPLKEVYSEVFGIEPEACLPLGMPRMDGFLDEEKRSAARDRFYAQHPECEGKRVILFAPTYRGKGQADAYYDYDWIDMKSLHGMCERTDSVWLFKMHPFVTDSVTIPEAYSDRIIGLNSTGDINELYYVTDVLVTDYSSNYFEYALTGGACMFYTPDRELYELTRGVHRSVKENAPGKLCDSWDELMEALEKKDYEIEKTLEFVKANYGDYTGDASAGVVERFLK